MTSQRKIEANRRNARLSTGPRSLSGKARSARNARQHGLAVPIWSDPLLTQNAESLARAIAGPEASPRLMAAARRVAEAQTTVAQVRRYVVEAIAPGYDRLSFFPQHGRVTVRPPTRKVLELLHGPPCPEKLAVVLKDVSKDAEAIDRYERRALSHLKFAIRDFDRARWQEAEAKSRSHSEPLDG
jgi:hypothetical protein